MGTHNFLILVALPDLWRIALCQILLEHGYSTVEIQEPDEIEGLLYTQEFLATLTSSEWALVDENQASL